MTRIRFPHRRWTDAEARLLLFGMESGPKNQPPAPKLEKGDEAFTEAGGEGGTKLDGKNVKNRVGQVSKEQREAAQATVEAVMSKVQSYADRMYANYVARFDNPQAFVQKFGAQGLAKYQQFMGNLGNVVGRAVTALCARDPALRNWNFGFQAPRGGPPKMVPRGYKPMKTPGGPGGVTEGFEDPVSPPPVKNMKKPGEAAPAPGAAPETGEKPEARTEYDKAKNEIAEEFKGLKNAKDPGEALGRMLAILAKSLALLQKVGDGSLMNDAPEFAEKKAARKRLSDEAKLKDGGEPKKKLEKLKGEKLAKKPLLEQQINDAEGKTKGLDEEATKAKEAFEKAKQDKPDAKETEEPLLSLKKKMDEAEKAKKDAADAIAKMKMEVTQIDADVKTIEGMVEDLGKVTDQLDAALKEADPALKNALKFRLTPDGLVPEKGGKMAEWFPEQANDGAPVTVAQLQQKIAEFEKEKKPDVPAANPDPKPAPAAKPADPKPAPPASEPPKPEAPKEATDVAIQSRLQSIATDLKAGIQEKDGKVTIEEAKPLLAAITALDANPELAKALKSNKESAVFKDISASLELVAKYVPDGTVSAEDIAKAKGILSKMKARVD